MNREWQYQIRFYLTDELAGLARRDRNDPALRPLADVLDRHKATMLSQFDAFESYVAIAEAQGPEGFPLYKWTKATVDDPEKRARHIRAFAVRVAGQEVYPKAEADALEADLQALVAGGLLTRLSRHDTDPANNMPVPPEYRP